MVNELLAPAQNLEAVKAVISYGADAVYCAGKRFGARSFISNLSDEDIIEASHYVHLHSKKIYITLNTFIFEDELEEALKYIDFLYQYVDAVIVQDYGIIHYIRDKYPDFPVHVSTQNSIHNIDDILFLKSLGVSRIVLARELSLEEINELNKLGIELEIFIHGALCFSYSGMCYLSYYQGGRSGNRGSCAQPCRQDYQLMEDGQIIKEGPLLSMKDLNTISHIKDILNTGVTSLKIEGRAKSIEYQISVVKLYRKLIDDFNQNKEPKVTSELLDDLYSAYSRERTLGYLFKDDNKDLTTDNSVRHQGILIGKVLSYKKGKALIKLNKRLDMHDGIRIIDKDQEVGTIVTKIMEDNKQVESSNSICLIDLKYPVNKDALIYKTLPAHILKDYKKYQNPYKNAVDLDIFIKNDYQKITLKCEEFIINKIYHHHLEKALTIKEEAVIKQFNKTNNLPIHFKNIKYKNSDKSYLPIPLINDIRREILDELYNYLINRKIRNNLPYPFKNEASLYCLNKSVNEITIKEEGLINYQHLVKKEVSFHLGEISSNSVISPYFGVCNHLAINFFRNITKGIIVTSFESSLENAIKLTSFDKNIGYLTSFNEPLMISNHCVVAKAKSFNKKECGSCHQHRYQLKFKNNIYDLSFNNCLMSIKGKSIDRINDPNLISVILENV